MLPAEVLARLPHIANDFPHMKTFVASIRDWIQQSGEPILEPVFPCLKPPGYINKYSMRGPTEFVGCIMKGKVAAMFSQEFGVDLWRLDSDELIHRFPVNKEQSVRGIIPTSSGDYIIIGHYSHLTHTMEIGVWSTHTGVEVLHSTFIYKFETLALDPDDTILMVSTILDVDPVTETVNR